MLDSALHQPTIINSRSRATPLLCRHSADCDSIEAVSLDHAPNTPPPTTAPSLSPQVNSSGVWASGLLAVYQNIRVLLPAAVSAVGLGVLLHETLIGLWPFCGCVFVFGTQRGLAHSPREALTNEG